MTDSFTFTVPGKPRGAARPRFSRGHAYMPPKDIEYRTWVKGPAGRVTRCPSGLRSVFFTKCRSG